MQLKTAFAIGTNYTSHIGAAIFTLWDKAYIPTVLHSGVYQFGKGLLAQQRQTHSFGSTTLPVLFSTEAFL